MFKEPGTKRVAFRSLAQGAIGSEFKIDASYLSPNVNMAARLEVRPDYQTSMHRLTETLSTV